MGLLGVNGVVAGFFQQPKWWIWWKHGDIVAHELNMVVSWSSQHQQQAFSKYESGNIIGISNGDSPQSQ